MIGLKQKYKADRTAHFTFPFALHITKFTYQKNYDCSKKEKITLDVWLNKICAFSTSLKSVKELLVFILSGFRQLIFRKPKISLWSLVFSVMVWWRLTSGLQWKLSCLLFAMTKRIIQPHKIIPFNETEKVTQNFYCTKPDNTIYCHAELWDRQKDRKTAISKVGAIKKITAV